MKQTHYRRVHLCPEPDPQVYEFNAIADSLRAAILQPCPNCGGPDHEHDEWAAEYPCYSKNCGKVSEDEMYCHYAERRYWTCEEHKAPIHKLNVMSLTELRESFKKS